MPAGSGRRAAGVRLPAGVRPRHQGPRKDAALASGCLDLPLGEVAMRAYAELSFSETLFLLVKAFVVAVGITLFGAGLGLGWLIWG